MSKLEFFAQLRKRLFGLPKDEIEERLSFYEEIIEDRMEEGLTEEEAVRAVGTVDEIASQIIAETPLVKIAKERIKPKRKRKKWESVLLILGSPFWVSLLIVAGAIIFAIYVSLWAVIISLWSAFVALIGCALGGMTAGIIFICTGHVHSGIAMIAAGLVCAGLSIFAFYGCKAATKGFFALTKKMAVWIKNCFRKKEVA